MGLTRTLEDFADEVGGADAGPVCVRGGATHWAVGGTPSTATRELRAPSGIVSLQPAEMIVRVGAGTTLAELHDALGAHGQHTTLDGPAGATVGGVLAVGRNGIRSMRHGAVRDTLLAATYVSGEGRIVHVGGPTVKNVTGFDLCRLLVGSLGTLGMIGEVTLRTRPVAPTSAWLAGRTDPFAILAALYRPAAVLWDGTTTWVALEGYAADVAAQRDLCTRAGLAETAHGPELPPGRWVGRPSALRTFAASFPGAGRFVAEIGVGIVHVDHAPTRPRPDAVTAALHARVRAELDPTGRCNPGRDPLAV